jgi:hypothetical protein
MKSLSYGRRALASDPTFLFCRLVLCSFACSQIVDDAMRMRGDFYLVLADIIRILTDATVNVSNLVCTVTSARITRASLAVAVQNSDC